MCISSSSFFFPTYWATITPIPPIIKVHNVASTLKILEAVPTASAYTTPLLGTIAKTIVLIIDAAKLAKDMNKKGIDKDTNESLESLI